jgi:hypothetical protein
MEKEKEVVPNNKKLENCLLFNSPNMDLDVGVEMKAVEEKLKF